MMCKAQEQAHAAGICRLARDCILVRSLNRITFLHVSRSIRDTYLYRYRFVAGRFLPTDYGIHQSERAEMPRWKFVAGRNLSATNHFDLKERVSYQWVFPLGKSLVCTIYENRFTGNDMQKSTAISETRLDWSSLVKSHAYFFLTCIVSQGKNVHLLRTAGKHLGQADCPC